MSKTEIQNARQHLAHIERAEAAYFPFQKRRYVAGIIMPMIVQSEMQPVASRVGTCLDEPRDGAAEEVEVQPKQKKKS